MPIPRPMAKLPGNWLLVASEGRESLSIFVHAVINLKNVRNLSGIAFGGYLMPRKIGSRGLRLPVGSFSRDLPESARACESLPSRRGLGLLAAWFCDNASDRSTSQ